MLDQIVQHWANAGLLEWAQLALLTLAGMAWWVAGRALVRALRRKTHKVGAAEHAVLDNMLARAATSAGHFLRDPGIVRLTEWWGPSRLIVSSGNRDDTPVREAAKGYAQSAATPATC